MSVSKRALYSIWHSEQARKKKLFAVETHVFTNIIDKSKLNKAQCRDICGKLNNFCCKLVNKWKDCHRNCGYFEKSNKSWLDGDLVLVKPPLYDKVVRPAKDEISNLINDTPNDELMEDGKRHGAMYSDESSAGKIKCVESDIKICTPYTASEALALYVDARFTKHTYKLLKADAKMRNANIYPTYGVLQSAKKRCYPNGVHATDFCAEVPLQSLVDHTVARIIEANSETFGDIRIDDNRDAKLTVTYKWGCDGSSEQNWSDTEETLIDEHFYVVSIVPLQVGLGSNILWKNKWPSSTRYCRPIKILRQKESEDLVRTEVESVKIQISKIIPTKLSTFQVHHQFNMTTIDGEILNGIEKSSSHTCVICKASLEDMNDINYTSIKNLASNGNLHNFGLSTLHAWNSFFECILDIAYRLPIKKCQIRDSDKKILDNNKTKMQKNIREKMSLHVDIPMTAFGNNNKGNTAIRFFHQHQLASQITGISEELLKRFSVILRSMACKQEIDTAAFRVYSLDTAKLFVQEYPWFSMPCAVHTILIHGADIISSVSLPLAMMSEEALEARYFQLNHARKTARSCTMKDLLLALLLSSDPFITSLSKSTSAYSNNNMELCSEVRGLLSDENFESQMSDSE